MDFHCHFGWNWRVSMISSGARPGRYDWRRSVPVASQPGWAPRREVNQLRMTLNCNHSGYFRMIRTYLVGVLNPSETCQSQLGWWHSQLNGKMKDVPNHQPVILPNLMILLRNDRKNVTLQERRSESIHFMKYQQHHLRSGFAFGCFTCSNGRIQP